MAFTVMRMGNEIPVNSFGENYQGNPSIAALGNGRWVVTWDGYGPAGRGVYQQVYGGEGTPVFTQEQRVNLNTTGTAKAPFVTAFGDGWLVTWTQFVAGRDEEIFMQRFDADGNPLLMSNGVPADIRVNQSFRGRQEDSKITVLDDGWLITWVDTYTGAVNQQRYDEDGQAQYRNGSNQIVNRRINVAPSSAKNQDAAAIDGGVAVVWSQQANTGSPYEIAFQILDENGDPIFGTNQLIAVTTTTYTTPRIQALPNGDGFLVVWAGADSDGQGVFLQKFNAAGVAEFDEPLQVNTIEAANQHDATVEVLADGSWIVTFSSGYDVFQRRYDSNGNPQGREVPIAAWLGSEWNQEADLAYLGDGRWVTAWSNWDQGDDQDNGISQRVFSMADTAVLTSGHEIAIGTADGEALDVQAGGLSSGDRIDGAGGNDTLRMIAAGDLDLSAPLQFTGFEIIQGSDGADTIITNAVRLSGITTINGGDGNDELRLFDGSSHYDLSGIVITDIERIALTDFVTTVTVGDVETGLLMHGEGSDDKVVLTGGESFSLLERYQLFRQRVETVKDSGGTYVKGIGEILNLAGDQVEAYAGATIRLDAGLDAVVPMGMPYYAKLSVLISGRVASQDRLVIKETARVTVEDDKVSVDGIEIGEIIDNGTGARGLTVALSEHATPARVQELLRALSYKNIATGSVVTDPRSINIALEDAGGSTTSVNVDVKVTTQLTAPVVTVSGNAGGTVADNGLIAPLAKVTVRDIDSLSVTVTVSFDSTKGRLVLGANNSGTYDHEEGTYTVTGDPYEITQDLRSLLFDPRDRNAPVGSSEQTTFTVSAKDSSGLSSNSETITITAVIANRAPGTPSLSGNVVKEMAADGAVVGTVSGGDPNPGDTVTYSLVGAEDAPFRLVTQSGVTQLVVTNGIKLDYEQRKDYTFTLRATDARGLSNDTIVSIRVDDVNPERTAGSSSNDVIKGGAGRDNLSGGLGDDKLFGGLGNDTLTGNAGKDIFVFNTKTNKKTNVDAIKDFSVKDDSIWLDNAIFTKIGKGTEDKPGKLSKAMFWKGKAAHDSSDRIIYDKATGALYYDADGTGRAAQVKIATLKKNLSLTEKDFFVI